MRKTWVKREHIYFVPFYKQKLKLTLLAVIVMAIIFFAYQIFYIKELQTETELLVKVKTGREKSVADRELLPITITTTTIAPQKQTRIIK